MNVINADHVMDTIFTSIQEWWEEKLSSDSSLISMPWEAKDLNKKIDIEFSNMSKWVQTMSKDLLRILWIVDSDTKDSKNNYSEWSSNLFHLNLMISYLEKKIDWKQ